LGAVAWPDFQGCYVKRTLTNAAPILAQMQPHVLILSIIINVNVCRATVVFNVKPTLMNVLRLHVKMAAHVWIF
jgi:hypothetical protein